MSERRPPTEEPRFDRYRLPGVGLRAAAADLRASVDPTDEPSFERPREFRASEDAPAPEWTVGDHLRETVAAALVTGRHWSGRKLHDAGSRTGRVRDGDADGDSDDTVFGVPGRPDDVHPERIPGSRTGARRTGGRGSRRDTRSGAGDSGDWTFGDGPVWRVITGVERAAKGGRAALGRAAGRATDAVDRERLDRADAALDRLTLEAAARVAPPLEVEDDTREPSRGDGGGVTNDGHDRARGSGLTDDLRDRAGARSGSGSPDRDTDEESRDR